METGRRLKADPQDMRDCVSLGRARLLTAAFNRTTKKKARVSRDTRQSATARERRNESEVDASEVCRRQINGAVGQRGESSCGVTRRIRKDYKAGRHGPDPGC
jgi:hypothetical protein